MDESSAILSVLDEILTELKALREEVKNRPAASYYYQPYPLPGAAPYYPQVWYKV